MPSPFSPNQAKGVVTVTAGGRINTARLEALARELPGRAARVAETHAHLVAYWADQFAPVQEVNDRGFLQNDRKLTIKQGIVVQKIGPTHFLVRATAPQSAPQEFGSRPHTIAPRAGRGEGWLKFYWQREGRFVRRAFVHHPGNPPHPFMAPARRRVAATFWRELRRMFEETTVPWQVRR